MPTDELDLLVSDAQTLARRGRTSPQGTLIPSPQGRLRNPNNTSGHIAVGFDRECSPVRNPSNPTPDLVRIQGETSGCRRLRVQDASDTSDGSEPLSTLTNDLYAAALRSMRRPGGARRWYARWEDGERAALGAALHRWCGAADPTDLVLLGRSQGVVLDIGCGPGRLVTALTRQRRHTVGVDTSATAVALARRADATVLLRSVFDRLPAEGRWDTVLLADGNVGIGGDPAVLLRRCGELVDPRGRVLVELRAGATGLRTGRLRLENEMQSGGWFPWADVGPDAIGGLAHAAGLRVQDAWQHRGRSFAALALCGGTG